MSNLTYLQDVGESRAERVTSDHPFPIKIPETPGVWQPPVAGQGVHRFVQVPGIGAAAAYASGDAFGGLIKFPGVFRAGKNSGWITGIYLIDRDDEGLAVDVPLFTRSFTPTADNSPFANVDNDGLYCRRVIQIGTFYDMGSWQYGEWTGARWIQADTPDLWTQLILRGTSAGGIAAGSEPWIGLYVVPD